MTALDDSQSPIPYLVYEHSLITKNAKFGFSSVQFSFIL